MINRSSFTSHLPHARKHFHLARKALWNRYPDYPQRRVSAHDCAPRGWGRGKRLLKRDRMRPSESHQEKASKHFHVPEVLEDAAWMWGILLLPNKGAKQKGGEVEVAVQIVTYGSNETDTGNMSVNARRGRRAQLNSHNPCWTGVDHQSCQ